MISFGFALWNLSPSATSPAFVGVIAKQTYHFEFTGMEHPNRKYPPEKATELSVLHSHLVEEAIVIIVHGDIDLRKAKTCTLQTL